MQNMSKVYIFTDAQTRIIRCEGGYTMANIQNLDDWVLIDQGSGDKYNLCQSHYFSGGLMDERGIYRYKLVDGVVQERTKEEMDADYTPPEPAPDLAAKVAKLEADNRDLQEALDLLLSGEVSEDG